MLGEKHIIGKYLGVPYLHRGRDLSGLDCWGLIIMAYADIDIKVIDLERYEKDWALKDGNLFVENYYTAWKPIPANDLKLMDVILFKNFKGIASHAGLYLSADKFIHGSKQGVVITRLSAWKERIDGAFRYDSN